MIIRTPMLHTALHDVAERSLDYFPGFLGGHPAGYGWHSGGTVPEAEQLALAELEVVHLIAHVPARINHEIGSEVVLTPLGVQVLSDWDSQFSAAHAAGVRSAAEPTRERAHG